MKIKIMTNEALTYLKNNLDSLASLYTINNKPENWIKEKLGKNAFVEVSELEFENFELAIDENHPASSDIYNIKLFFLKLKELNDSFATDERLWAGLSHTIFYEYLIKRWKKKNDKSSILNHFFFSGSKPRCYMVNTLARLWWIGKKTYLENEEDPFIILDYISHDINGYLFTLFGSNWSNSERSLKLFFSSIFKYEKDTGNKVGRQLFNDAMKHTNCLCGLYMIDACDDNFITEKIYDYVSNRYDEIIKEAEFNKLNNVRTTGIEKFDLLIKAINKIGGHGSLAQIYKAYESLYEHGLTIANKEYIKRCLEENCPDSPSYKNKIIFYKIYINDSLVWKVSNDYLIKDNYKIRNEFLVHQLNNLNSNERRVYNIISAIKGDKFTLEDIELYKPQLKELWPEIKDINNDINDALKSLRKKGLIEVIDHNIYKKAYQKFAI